MNNLNMQNSSNEHQLGLEIEIMQNDWVECKIPICQP